ncbi:efflux RND transporter permease subunit [Reyranella sp.]|uniref:efflux RND transporter permease subunit n=1 Tax=Reyranella sp. TaxID=1929291 RepID=UPI00378453DD
MWIVKLALLRPYTFIVLSLMLIIGGIGSTIRLPKDIFPAIKEPTVTILWQYPGFPAAKMANDITEWSEFLTSQFVVDIKRMESRNIFGFGMMRLYFHPQVDIDRALAQVTATSQTILKKMPVGTTPPYVLIYDPSSVPVMLVALASETLTESQLFDFGQFTVRQAIAPVEGAQLPLPWGGNARVIMIDLDPEKMMAHGVTADDINTAMLKQNVILPTGSVRIGRTEYMLQMNNSPTTMELLNAVPIKSSNGNIVYVRDVAHVRDGYQPQTNLVRLDGQKTVFLSVGKSGSVSTLDIIAQTKEVLKTIPTPGDLQFTILFDQSIYVLEAIQGVVVEGLIAAGLTGLLILVFLGSWRGTLVVVISIPICIFTSILLLGATGNTLNLMTLGGLALSVGILVDDATVTLENIHRHLAMGKNLIRSILDGAQEIAIPAFVSTLCICIVFLPVGLLTGPPRFLFVPMALAVLFAIATSYLLSRTLVPVLANYLIRGEHRDATQSGAGAAAQPGFFRRAYLAFDSGFLRLRARYVALLARALHHPVAVLAVFAGATILAALAVPGMGRDFFPPSDGSSLRLHVSAPTGTRIEETGVYFSKVEETMREVMGDDIAVILDNIGIPEPNNLIFSDNITASSADGEILVALKPTRRHGSLEYSRRLRQVLPERYPELLFYFQPSDMKTQILNLGLPAPIDIKVFGLAKTETLHAVAQKIEKRLLAVPGAVDIRIQQRLNQPALKIDVDRDRAAKMAREEGLTGFTQRDVARNVLMEASSSLMVNPNFWTDPQSGHTYWLVVQSPLDKLSRMEDLTNIPIRGSGGAQTQFLGNIAEISRTQIAAQVDHTNVLVTFDVMANVQGVDTGSVVSAVRRIIAEESVGLTKGIVIEMGGQGLTMDRAFDQLGQGLLAAVLLVYFILVINFQSWTDPFIIIMALPGAFCGVVVMLLLTQTTFSVPSLMGAIMTVGVATANSILVISFAKNALNDGQTAIQAALSAGEARFRPVIMTVIAMVFGMVPMSLGLSEGGDQNAPLGRAVIGGMLFACIATLVLVPVIFSLMHRHWRPATPQEGAELLRA